MINGIDNASTASWGVGGTPPLSKSQSDELRESFLLLLTTQMQNQDPMNPLENSEMTSQIAQINTVSGIEQLNQTLQAITGQIDQNKALQASALIGKGVLVPGNQTLLEQGEEDEIFTTPFGISLERPAENVRVTISSASGETINQFDLGPVDAGVSSFRWDGLSSDGETAASGAYRVTLEATNADDERIAAETLNYAQVGAVTPQDQDGNVRLDLGAVYGQVGLDDIRMIL